MDERSTEILFEFAATIQTLLAELVAEARETKEQNERILSELGRVTNS